MSIWSYVLDFDRNKIDIGSDEERNQMNQIFGGVKEFDEIDCVPTHWFWYHDFDGGDSTQD